SDYFVQTWALVDDQRDRRQTHRGCIHALGRKILQLVGVVGIVLQLSKPFTALCLQRLAEGLRAGQWRSSRLSSYNLPVQIIGCADAGVIGSRDGNRRSRGVRDTKVELEHA